MILLITNNIKVYINIIYQQKHRLVIFILHFQLIPKCISFRTRIYQVRKNVRKNCTMYRVCNMTILFSQCQK